METYWIVFLCALLPLWLLQNVIHELSHGLTVWMGWKWKFKIFPFPSTKLGRFTFAHVTYHNVEGSKPISDVGHALISIMPKIVNILFILKAQMWILLASDYPSLAIIFLTFAWCNFIDFTVGALAIFKSPNKSDLWKFQSYSGIRTSLIKCSIIGWIIYLFLCNTTGTIVFFI